MLINSDMPESGMPEELIIVMVIVVGSFVITAASSLWTSIQIFNYIRRERRK